MTSQVSQAGVTGSYPDNFGDKRTRYPSQELQCFSAEATLSLKSGRFVLFSDAEGVTIGGVLLKIALDTEWTHDPNQVRFCVADVVSDIIHIFSRDK
jgi:hypothetical protein